MLSTASFSEFKSLLDRGRAEEARKLLLRLQAERFALREQVRHLLLRVTALEGLLPSSLSALLEGGLLWMEGPEGRKGPFCPLCHEADEGLVALVQKEGDWACPSCGARIPKRSKAPDGAELIPFTEACRRLGI